MNGGLDKGDTAATVRGKEEHAKHNFRHLKPLSKYSRMMPLNQGTSAQDPNNLFKHFNNFKVEINNSSQKRKRENSSCDDGHESPSRKFLFDCDVDILCLSPSTTDAAKDVSNGITICHNPMNRTLQNKHEQQNDKTHVQKIMEDMKNRHVIDELDKGTFSMSFTKLPAATSSPLPMTDEDKALKNGCHSETSERAIQLAQQDSISDSGLGSSVFIPVLDLNSPVRCLEGDADDIPHIGSPIFESSLCRSDSVCAGFENTRELSSKELQGSSIGFSVNHYHTTQESDVVDTSCETNPPTKITLKSVVVVPNLHTTCVKPVFPTELEQNNRHATLKPEDSEYERGAIRHSSQRPDIFNGDLALEQKKKQYIHLVTKQINDTGSSQDVMKELVNLMNHVADHNPACDTPWQHPSNLTRKNYRRRLNSSTPKLSLQEWQSKNGTHKRFANVPKIFTRSPLP